MSSSAYQLSVEDNLDSVYAHTIFPYWQQNAECLQFDGVNGRKICFAKLPPQEANGNAIVISPGRTEAYLKYTELAYDLTQQGYHVYIIDHRGQGLSERETKRQQPGDVAQFQYYVDDLAQLLEQFVLPKQYQQCFLLAHSMGGAIAAHYLQQQPNVFTAAALSAPMFEINLGAVPMFAASALASLMVNIEHTFNCGPYYAPGQSDYKHGSFSTNLLTHSQIRFKHMQQVYRDNPQIQLGGPTNRWLYQSFKAMQSIIEQAKTINTPLLLLQAEQDSIVMAAGQNAFYESLMSTASPHNKLLPVPGSKHEILFESDSIRHPALSSILDFFASHTN
ncbi:alpha/beta fold hydrolase [Agarivorans sp. MS3-6]|uniref:alpha/beta fold hydrolase n=1 Tax=Agarivorans sp. TSD2052 TaxID=2937286 RepID=UPI00200DCE46|nr:alpha/beta fold hydrolase [Agarivorans sp. TSD2052]UPW18894.1 alpha/beta fold hydrolase [Agarivorans sp. TSD2052]